MISRSNSTWVSLLTFLPGVCVLSLSDWFQIPNVFYKAWGACVKVVNSCQLLADQEPAKWAEFVSRLWNFAL